MSNLHPKSKEYINDTDDESSNDSGSGSDSDNIDRVVPTSAPLLPSEKSNAAYPKFEPAKGLYPVTVSATYSSPFEMDNISSKPGVQLWTIRVPRDLKVSRMANLSMDPASGTGTLKTSAASFKLREAGPSKPRTTSLNAEERDTEAGAAMVDAMEDENAESSTDGGQEMSGMRLMLPSKRSGKLSTAPMAISRKFVLTAIEDCTRSRADDEDSPSFLTSTAHPTQERLHKRKQPLHLLAFRNRACGFDTPGPKRGKTSS